MGGSESKERKGERVREGGRERESKVRKEERELREGGRERE